MKMTDKGVKMSFISDYKKPKAQEKEILGMKIITKRDARDFLALYKENPVTRTPSELFRNPVRMLLVCLSVIAVMCLLMYGIDLWVGQGRVLSSNLVMISYVVVALIFTGFVVKASHIEDGLAEKLSRYEDVKSKFPEVLAEFETTQDSSLESF